MISTAILLIMVCYIAFCLYEYFFPKPSIDPKGKYVLISGCDTGIGHELALKLDERGFNVVVGVLDSTNVTAFRTKFSSRTTIIHLDISKQDNIDAAYDLIRSKTDTLYGLVNNAGIMTHGCIDWTSMEMMRKLMDVNHFGHVAITKKFLPLLIAKRNSRVVNVISAAGYFAFPNTSAYTASKHALKGFTDCLRREMSPWSLHVSMIEPGALKTPMLANYEETWRNTWNRLSPEVQQRWGVSYLDFNIRHFNSPFMKYADGPTSVVRSIEHAIMSGKPRIRYQPDWQGKLIFFLLYPCPVWLADRILSLVWNITPESAL